jgi:hypothetical protein
MQLSAVDWEANKDLPVGKGATVQQFFATVGTAPGARWLPPRRLSW